MYLRYKSTLGKVGRKSSDDKSSANLCGSCVPTVATTLPYLRYEVPQ